MKSLSAFGAAAALLAVLTGPAAPVAAQTYPSRTITLVVAYAPGAGPALNDLLGGHVDFFFSGLPAAVPYVQAGKLKLLAVSPGKRSSFAPDVPTVAEASGIADFDIALWQGFFAPRGTPGEVVARLNAEINRILADPSVKAKLVAAGAEIAPTSVAQFEAFVKTEVVKFAAIIKDAGIKPD